MVPAIDQRVVLIRIPRKYRPGMSEQALYEATRKWWVMSPERHHPEYAFAVADGTVRAAYRIEDWERNDAGTRWAFSGQRDPALEDLYRGSDVTDRFPRGAQNPIRYVNC